MGQHTAGAATAARGRGRSPGDLGRLALAVAAGVAVGAVAFAVVDRAVDGATVDQRVATVEVVSNQEADRALAGEKALLVAGRGVVVEAPAVTSVSDAANLLAREKATLVELRRELVQAEGGMAADKANALVRADAAAADRVDQAAADRLAEAAEAANRFRQAGG